MKVKRLGILLLLGLAVMAVAGHGASTYDKTYTAYMVGNSHIDAAWRWRMPETVKVCRNTFSTMIYLLDRNPDFRFARSSALYYQWMQEYYPELFAEIKRQVAHGAWEIVGGQVIEPDFNLPSGESLVRQFLYGKRYFRDQFGVDVKVGFAPDSFGFAHSLPQILKKSGIDFFILQKLNWNDTNPFPHEVFRWRGLDGSKVTAYKTRYDYQTLYDRTKISRSLRLPDSLGIKGSLCLWGVGDHGGGPTQAGMDRLREFDQKGNGPQGRVIPERRLLCRPGGRPAPPPALG